MPSAPTKHAIEKRLEWLAADASPGDCLLIHFSGHSLAVLDRNARPFTALTELAGALHTVAGRLGHPARRPKFPRASTAPNTRATKRKSK